MGEVDGRLVVAALAYLWPLSVLFVSLWVVGGFLGGFEGTLGVKSATDNLSFSAMHRSWSIIILLLLLSPLPPLDSRSAVVVVVGFIIMGSHFISLLLAAG